MRIATLVASFFLIVATFFLVGAGPVKYSEESVPGNTHGNHDLDCTVIRPWGKSSGSGNVQYPVIGWANGWGGNDVVGDDVTEGYKPGLIEWALNGPYIVVAANQWSVQESDVLACVQWVIDQNTTADSEYEGVVNEAKIGLAGHSQGGGAVIKAGDGWTDDLDEITAVVAMNPYGPGWVNPGNQDGPVMLVGGDVDTTTPPGSYDAVWDGIQENDEGGINAVLIGCTHNSEAWGVDSDGSTLSTEDAKEFDFGEFQLVTELWWDFHLNGNAASGRRLKRLLDRGPSDTQYAFTEDFEL
jgi:hypothetical protein